MDLQITLEGRHDMSGQIYRQIRAAVVDGRLSPGEPVPPSRDLAGWLSVSRNTVAAAYDRLVAEGFLVGRVGAGTFVNEVSEGIRRALPPTVLQPRAIWNELDQGELAGNELAWNQLTDPAEGGDAPEFDLRPGMPDTTLFPYVTWRRLLGRSVLEYDGPGDPCGHAGLRVAVAGQLTQSRTVQVDAADVVVTNGGQQALDLIGRVLFDPGAVVAVEDPGYPGARQAFTALGARVVTVPVDAEGLMVDTIPQEARCVYTTPSHQYPLGMPMSLARRIALLRWAEDHDAALIEDDYDSEFRFGGRPIEPMRRLDRAGRVIYVGSFSKTLLPTLRLGFLLTPPSLRRAFRVAKLVTDRHSALPAQAALADFIDGGHFARHVKRLRPQYEERHERIVSILRRDFGAWLSPVESVAGLHLCARAHSGDLDDLAVAAKANALGLALQPLSALYAGAVRRPGFVIGYGRIPLTDIDAALVRLRQVLAE